MKAMLLITLILVGGNAFAEKTSMEQLIGETMMVIEITDRRITLNKDSFNSLETTTIEKCSLAGEAIAHAHVAKEQLDYLLAQYPELQTVRVIGYFVFRSNEKIRKIRISVLKTCGEGM